MTAKQRQIMRCPKGSLFLEYESVSPHGRGVWYARVPVDHDLDDVLSPDYFGQTDKELKVGDIIDIEPEHALWRIQVRVMAVVPSLAQVKLREAQHMRQSYAVKAPTGYKFAWKGEKARWAIVKGDVEVDAGFDTQDEALARIEELAKEKAA